MKALLLSLFCLLASGLAAQEKAAPDFSVLTFNIRYGTANDGLDSWPLRQHRTLKVFEENPADFICLQEALRFQLDAIAKALPQHAETSAGRDDGKTKGEHCAIFHRADRWIVAASGTYWLCETPETPGAKGWGATLPRVCTWARYVSRANGKGLWIANVHLDHQSEKARRESVRLVAKRLAARPFPDEPALIAGDFNTDEDSNAYNYLTDHLHAEACPLKLQDAFRTARPDEKPAGTFHAFKANHDGGHIDYIFATKELKVLNSSIIRTTYEGRAPSDHFPVSAGFAW